MYPDIVLLSPKERVVFFPKRQSEKTMNRLVAITFLALVAATATAGEPAQRVITTGTLLDEMKDLGALARWPMPAYRTVQFSSYDRRSTTPESPAGSRTPTASAGSPSPAF